MLKRAEHALVGFGNGRERPVEARIVNETEIK